MYILIYLLFSLISYSNNIYAHPSKGIAHTGSLLYRSLLRSTSSYPNRLEQRMTYKTLIPWLAKQKGYNTISAEKAKGCYFWDEQDKKYIDFTSGLMVVNLGHAREELKQCIISNLEKGLDYFPPSISTTNRELLAERLIEISPIKDGKVFFSNGGADANEVALFISLEYHRIKGNPQKKRLLSFEKSFHGGSTYVASLMGGDTRKKFKLDAISANIESILPNPISGEEYSSLTAITRIIEEEHENIAAILLEGSSGSAGCYLYPKNYLETIREKARQHDILFIDDEVMSAWGRAGNLFAVEKANLKYPPDIITTAKGLTNGCIPMGAVIISEEISSLFDNNPLLTGLTYSGHPLACTVANTCLDLYLEDNQKIISQARRTGNYLKNKAQDLVAKHSSIKELRIQGLLGCFELKDHPQIVEILATMQTQLKNLGVFIFARERFLFLAPPLTIEAYQIDETLDLFSNALDFIDSTYYDI